MPLIGEDSAQRARALLPHAGVIRGTPLSVFTSLAVLGVCAACVPTTLHANLLTNGDFESPGAALTTSYANVAGTNKLAPWVTMAGNGDNPAVYYAASNGGAAWIPSAQSGGYSVQLDSTTTNAYTAGSSIRQAFDITQAGTYQLSFWINTEQGAGKGGTSAVDVSLYSGAGRYVLNSTEFTVTNPVGVGAGKALWQNYTVGFSVDATQIGNYKLVFADSPNAALNNYPNSNVSLDNVSVDLVPEFAHWGVFAGFGLLVAAGGGWRRRRPYLPPCPP